jgi:hypothetical protein
MEFELEGPTQAYLYARLPLSERPELLVIGTKDDQPFYFHTNVTLTKEKNEKVVLKPDSWDNILAKF